MTPKDGHVLLPADVTMGGRRLPITALQGFDRHGSRDDLTSWHPQHNHFLMISIENVGDMQQWTDSYWGTSVGEDLARKFRLIRLDANKSDYEPYYKTVGCQELPTITIHYIDGSFFKVLKGEKKVKNFLERGGSRGRDSFFDWTPIRDTANKNAVTPARHGDTGRDHSFSFGADDSGSDVSKTPDTLHRATTAASCVANPMRSTAASHGLMSLASPIFSNVSICQRDVKIRAVPA